MWEYKVLWVWYEKENPEDVLNAMADISWVLVAQQINWDEKLISFTLRRDKRAV